MNNPLGDFCCTSGDSPGDELVWSTGSHDLADLLDLVDSTSERDHDELASASPGFELPQSLKSKTRGLSGFDCASRVGSKAIGSSNITTPRKRDLTRKKRSTRKVCQDADNAIRVRTYTARKNEIRSLRNQIPVLESYVEYLKHHAARVNNKASSTDKLRLINSSLRTTARNQAVLFAVVKSASTQLSLHEDNFVLFDSFLHLEADREARIDTLRNFKTTLIRNAKLHTQARIQHIDLAIPSTETHSYVSPSGHYCMQKFVTMPLDGVSDVRQVFEKLKYFLGRLEVLMSEKTGDVTVCEEVVRVDNKDSDDSIVQHHLLRSTPTGYQVQSNEVTFESFEEREDEFGDGRALGVIVVRSVDKDDSYGYTPGRNLRQDLTSVFTVRSLKRSLAPGKKCSSSVSASVSGSQSCVGGGGVVVTRCSLHKLHSSSLRVSRMDLEDTLEELSRRGDVLLKSVRRSLDPSPSCK